MAISNFSQVNVQTAVLIAAPSSDATAAVRNTEFNAAIDPLEAASHAAAALLNTDGSIAVATAGQNFTLAVILFTAGLAAGQGQIGVSAGNGLYVLLGTGANVAAAGNHAHADATDSTDGFMAAADKTKLDGIAAGATALALAGSGTAATAAHSDHIHPEVTEETDGFMIAADKAKLDALPIAADLDTNTVATVAAALENSDSVTFTFVSGALKFGVLLSTDLSAGEGAIGLDAENGLYVVLGTGANQAAAGNHTHPIATESVAGFLSAADKTKLDTLTSTYWRDPVATTSALPLNTDPVGTCRLVTGSNAVYRCISNVGLLADQWRAFIYSLNGLTVTATTGTLTIANLKTLTVSNTLTFVGTDGSTLNIGAGGTLGTAAFTAASAYDAVGAAATAGAAAVAISLQKTANLSDVASAATAREILARRRWHRLD